MGYLAPRVYLLFRGMGMLLAGLWLAGCSTQTAEQHLANALQYRADGNDDAAIIELKNALKKDAKLQPARSELAYQLFASGDYAAAENEFERAMLTGVGDPVISESARADLREGQRLSAIRTQQAASIITELSELESITPRERAVLGLARLALDDIELARQDFSAALAEDPELPYANFGAARVFWFEGEASRAWPLLVKASQLAPRDPNLLLVQGEFALEQNNMEGAREAFSAARALPGRDVPARLGLARVLIFEQALGAATTEIAGVLELAPDYVPALYLDALVAYEQEDHSKAELSLREVQSLQPNYTAAFYLMGAVQFQLRDYAQSELNLKRYLESQPGNVSARKLFAAVLMQREDYDGVINALAPVGDAQNDAQLLAMLGTAYARTDRLSQASVLLDRAVELAPDVEQLRNQLAVTLLAAGETEQAVGTLQSAIKLDGKMMLSDYLLVLALLREGKADEALAAAESLRDRAPDDPMGDNLVGAVRFTQGDKAAARESFNAALSKNAAFEPAVLNLVRLNIAEGNSAGAAAELNRLLEVDPDNERGLLRLAELTLQNSSSADKDSALKTAEKLLERAVLAHAESLAPKIALARLGLLTSNLRLADTYSKETQELAPEDINAVSLRVEFLLFAKRQREARVPLAKLAQLVRNQQPIAPAQLLALARLQENAGLPDEALLSYNEASESGGTYFQSANLALLRADLRREALVTARTRLESADEATKNTALWRLLAADLARAENNPQDAERGYAALLAEGNRDALFRLVALHTQSDAPAKAAELLKDWLTAHPDDAGVEIALATAALTAGDYGASQQRFEQALDIDPDNVVVLNNLAYLYQQTKDDRALPTARKAWELAPGNADVGDTYGWILFQEGEEALGRDVLVKAMELAPEDPLIGYHAAAALAATGGTEQAIAALQRITQPPPGTQGRFAFSAAPEFDDALELLASLRTIEQVDVDTKVEADLVE